MSLNSRSHMPGSILAFIVPVIDHLSYLVGAVGHGLDELFAEDGCHY